MSCYLVQLEWIILLTDNQVLRPMSRLGGDMYGRTTQLMELNRPDFERDFNGFEGLEKLKEAKEKQ
jgi:hypothetical protein